MTSIRVRTSAGHATTRYSAPGRATTPRISGRMRSRREPEWGDMRDLPAFFGPRTSLEMAEPLNPRVLRAAKDWSLGTNLAHSLPQNATEQHARTPLSHCVYRWWGVAVGVRVGLLIRRSTVRFRHAPTFS